MIFSIIFLLLGFLIGSFLNVLVYRLRSAEEIFWDRSKCPHCQHMIRWFDNVPVLSFILLRSRCRDCKQKISWQYPLIEILTGLAFVLVGQKFFHVGDFSSWIATAYYFVIAASLISIAVYDWLYLEIPSEVLWFGVVLAVAFGLYSDWATWTSLTLPISIFGYTVYSGIFAAFFSFLFFFLLSAVSRERWMGMGDAYLAILLGLVVAWPKILLALFLAFFFGSVWGLAMIMLKKKKMKSRLPFAPFMILGTFIALLFYIPIVNWYFSLFRF